MKETADIFQAIFVMLACWSAIAALDAWKREFIGKRQIELAETTLAKFFELRDAIAFIRNPFSYSGEGNSRNKGEHETEKETKILNRAYIVHERFEKKKDIFNDFSLLKYKFLASFGKESESIFLDINKIVNSILIAAEQLGSYYWIKNDFGSMEQDEKINFFKEKKELEALFWSMADEKDEIIKQLNTVLEELEAVTKPCFEPPSTIYSFLTKKLSFWK